VRDLVGEYRADYGFATESVLLRSDGTYRQDVTIAPTHVKGGILPSASAEGQWRFVENAKPGQSARRAPPTVDMTRCLSLVGPLGETPPAHYHIPTRGLCIGSIERRYYLTGGVCIARYPDHGRLCRVGSL
jgi:hypothetical protein